jgi:hypothetical protein
MAIMATTIAKSIHRDTENPIFGGGVTHIRVEDEAGGGFLVLEQTPEVEPNKAELRLEIDELEFLALVGREMIDEYEAATKGLRDE